MASSSPILSYWHPNVTYDFTLRIGEIDLSTSLVRLEIKSAVTQPYQNFFLDIFMDPRDILSEELFGQQPIKLIIRMEGKQQGTFADKIEFDLLYLGTEGGYAPAQKSYITDQWERSVVRFKTVCSKPYQTMSAMVNKIYQNTTPSAIISDLVSSYTEAKLESDTAGQSQLAIDQLLIPPTTLYKVVKYLNGTYGVFNGPMGFHCTHENKIKLQNLSKKVSSAQVFTLYLIATDLDNKKLFERDDADVFYTQKAVTSAYNGNAIFASNAPTIRYIVKPKNTLYNMIDINLESFAKTYGVIEKNNPQVYFNKEAINPNKRIMYKKDQTGYDSDQTFINANLSPSISDIAGIVAEITGNLPILNLMAVGEHTKVISQVDDHLKLGGAYILKGSDIQFIKSNTWESTAMIYLTRTNIAMQ